MDWLSLIGPPVAAILVLVVLVVLLREKRDDSVADLEGERDQSTPHLSRLLGYEPADLVGPLSMDIIHPEDRLRAGRICAEQAGTPASGTTFVFCAQLAY